MAQIIEAHEKYFRYVKLNMPRVVQNRTPSPKIGLNVEDYSWTESNCQFVSSIQSCDSQALFSKMEVVVH